MNFTDLKTGRLAKGWSQVEAAGRLKVSQSYLAMLEGGVRRMTPDLARRAMRVYDLAPTALPPSERDRRPRSEEHTSELQSRSDLVCRLLLEKKKNTQHASPAAATRTR